MKIVTDEVEAYSLAQTTPPPEHLQALGEETKATQECPQMLTGPVEGRLLETLVWISRPRLIVELGTYSGYSAQFMAAALPDDGRLISCELDPQRAEFARERLRDPRVEIRVGPALETLATIDGPIDLAFIDADKGGYPAYYDAVVPKLSARGLIVADNTLHGGGALEGDLMHDFNEHVLADPRTVSVLLPVRDGVTLIRLA